MELAFWSRGWYRRRQTPTRPPRMPPHATLPYSCMPTRRESNPRSSDYCTPSPPARREPSPLAPRRVVDLSPARPAACAIAFARRGRNRPRAARAFSPRPRCRPQLDSRDSILHPHRLHPAISLLSARPRTPKIPDTTKTTTLKVSSRVLVSQYSIERSRPFRLIISSVSRTNLQE